MKKIKTICSILCAAVLFIGVGKILHYILVDDTSSYTRLTMHELYHADSNIDVLFVGSSHVYRSLNPEITDDIFKLNTFNAGTSSQGMDGSLALIKEAMTYHNIQEIYLEIYFDIALGVPNKERTQMTQTYIISDYMRPSVRKATYLLQASNKDYYVTGFLPVRREWEKCFDLNYIFELIEKKQKDNYKKYQWTRSKNDKEYYVAKGYVANESELTEADLYTLDISEKIIDVNSISDDWRKSLYSIISICKKENIKLTLFTAPMPEFYLTKQINYYEFSDYIHKLALKENLTYFDFNFCKSDIFSNEDISNFYDEQHLNAKGAAKFSKVFSEFFTDQLSKNDLF